MRIKRLAVGDLEANAYILFDEEEKNALVVDPGGEPDRILRALDGAVLRGILLTHPHVDHIGAVEALRCGGIPVAIHSKDADALTDPQKNLSAPFHMEVNPGTADVLLEEGACEFGGFSFEVLHTPGHTPGSCCFRFGEKLLTGDTIFANGDFGRTDFPGGNVLDMRASLTRLLKLPAEWKILPGHGGSSTIGKEIPF